VNVSAICDGFTPTTGITIPAGPTSTASAISTAVPLGTGLHDRVAPRSPVAAVELPAARTRW
jgi:hypothetical protein